MLAKWDFLTASSEAKKIKNLFHKSNKMELGLMLNCLEDHGKDLLQTLFQILHEEQFGNEPT